MDKIITIASSCGMVAFGFLAYMQAKIILMAQNEVICYADVGFTDIWIVEIGILILCTIASTLCFNLTITGMYVHISHVCEIYLYNVISLNI
mgnify:CR=1 FL=1